MDVAEVRHLEATVVFDLEDRWLRDRGIAGSHPRPSGPIRFLLAGEIQGGVRRDYAQPLELELVRNGDGFHVSFGIVREAQRRRALPAGRYVVRVVSDLYQQAELAAVDVPRPAAAYAVALEPGYAYSFASGTTIPGGLGPTLLRGRLAAPDGSGIAGATVEVTGSSNAYRTDESGQWVLVFPDTAPSGNVTVHVDFADGSAVDAPGVAIVAGRDQTLADTALRGWVQTGGGAPISGAVVTVSGRPETTVSGRDGAWTYVFPLDQVAVNVTVTATLPDGRAASQPNVPVQPRSTVVVPTFRFV